jgi:hypothetical protein
MTLINSLGNSLFLMFISVIAIEMIVLYFKINNILVGLLRSLPDLDGFLNYFIGIQSQSHAVYSDYSGLHNPFHNNHS